MQSHVDEQPNLFQSVAGYIGLLLRLERRLLALVVSYSLAIGLFALIEARYRIIRVGRGRRLFAS